MYLPGKSHAQGLLVFPDARNEQAYDNSDKYVVGEDDYALQQ